MQLYIYIKLGEVEFGAVYASELRRSEEMKKSNKRKKKKVKKNYPKKTLFDDALALRW